MNDTWHLVVPVFDVINRVGSCGTGVYYVFTQPCCSLFLQNEQPSGALRKSEWKQKGAVVHRYWYNSYTKPKTGNICPFSNFPGQLATSLLVLFKVAPYAIRQRSSVAMGFLATHGQVCCYGFPGNTQTGLLLWISWQHADRSVAMGFLATRRQVCSCGFPAGGNTQTGLLLCVSSWLQHRDRSVVTVFQHVPTHRQVCCQDFPGNTQPGLLL